ncbi:A/G-specific adenine glycosylase [Paenisporosarcina cavernae]|uniref:Adenine DNA glycosylase n=1 Tax=Paenisporosarcina cavernae TaxID=2320858 RepID=A0A385YVB8_9BACL|nr:A/G-specific adenine glycosylase [Paenisporosarcina cavernae]AYC30230.1 A/G-specific adenine glycosylase [Paenisporosarcina cavernae]
MKAQDIRRFREALLTWYHKEKRDLPWRKANDPYHIWISEVMLQQTKVDTVIPYYEKFIEAYPTLPDMAAADEEHVLKNWEGLGYYSRARNLHAGVKEVVERYNGSLPTTREEISSIRGIGPYTAGAILSIAYQVPEHAVDGNVMRVLSRVLFIEEDIAKPKTKKIFEEAVMELIDRHDPSGFNQGLMELGATICTPTKPSCLLCPINDVCEAFSRGLQETLPIKTKKTKALSQQWNVLVVENEHGELLMEKRQSKGLLANMWQFPMMDPNELDVSMFAEKMTLKHVFSHLIWELNVFYVKANDLHMKADGVWKSADEIEKLPKAVPMIKIWDAYKKENVG